MEAKEKAKELIEKFISVNGNSFFAKDCALIAVVNEYHSLREQLFQLRVNKVIENGKVYLALLDKTHKDEAEVKQEIEKL
jgi:hypothetical protein